MTRDYYGIGIRDLCSSNRRKSFSPEANGYSLIEKLKAKRFLNSQGLLKLKEKLLLMLFEVVGKLWRKGKISKQKRKDKQLKVSKKAIKILGG